MPYVHDIFLSYLHDAQMDGWVRQHLVPFLESFVGNALNRPVKIFIDRSGIHSGDTWPIRLQRALAESRCLVAVWSPLYFHSEWCRRECATALHRESNCGYRTVEKPNGLIVPVNVFDGKFFPVRVQSIQWLDCRKFWIVGEGFLKTERYVEFQDTLRFWAEDVANTIEDAPPWDEAWLLPPWNSPPDDDLRPPARKNFQFTGLESI
jgi:hypothetical protein